MSRPWDRIEDLFKPLDAADKPAGSLDDAVMVHGFGNVYAELQRLANEAQDRMNGQEDGR